MKIQLKWPAELYHSNSGAQQAAAKHLINLLQLSGNENVLDVGCGDGKITAEIAKLLPQGSVLGIDASSEMISFASHKFPAALQNNLKFAVQYAQEINYSSQFDVMFSSFALQWVLDIEAFFQKAHTSLKQNGQVACTIPLSISDGLEESLAFLLRDPQWASYFNGCTLSFYLRNAEFFENLLLESGFIKTHFEVVNQEWIFPSRADFENYTSPWLPHLKILPVQLQKQFFAQLIDKYLEINPVSDAGEVSFMFQRVDFIAKKQASCH